MGLYDGFYTSLTGLNANSHTINVTGDNIANANTTGFKSARAEFDTQIQRLLADGSAPTATSGGTNPTQIGMGVRLAGTSRSFADGSFNLTGIDTDMAIEGGGFFIVNKNGETSYTRAGNFQRNSDALLTTVEGGVVQGFGVDEDFNIVEGVLQDLSIPIGALTLAQSTSQVKLSGNLNAGGDVAANGSLINSATLYSDPGATTPIVSGDDLTSLYDSSGNQLLTAGDVVHFADMARGGATIPDKTFEIGPTNTTGSDAHGQTIDQLLSFLETTLGIDTSVGGGVSLAGGQIAIEGNTGTLNDLAIDGASIYVNSPTGSKPFEFNKNRSADGESVRTTFRSYNSLGQSQTVDLTLVLENTDDFGSTWRFYAQSEDDSDLSTLLGNGTVTFDTNGQIVTATDTEITLDQGGVGANTPQPISLVFDDANLGVSALADTASQLSVISQDGAPIGTLDSFSVQTDGLIVGEFSNGLVRNLGQVTLATFVNPQGLESGSGNNFQETTASGNASITTPGNGAAGRVIGQALELSNVDITNEFINLVTASTGFSANSRVFSTSDSLLQELLSIIR